MTSDEAHLWLVDPESVSLDHVFLAADEIERMERFHFERDRRMFRAGRGLARVALSAAAPGVEPAEWRFEAGARGRPEIAAPAIETPLRFNVSHTEGLVACVVTVSEDCGVDVESVGRARSVDDLLETVLTPAERAAISSLPAAERPMRFCRYWTLKEAYAKARGLGLSLPFDEVAFDLTDDRARMTAGDDPARWQFEQWAETDRHIVAVALRRGAVGVYRVVVHRGLPFMSSRA